MNVKITVAIINEGILMTAPIFHMCNTVSHNIKVYVHIILYWKVFRSLVWGNVIIYR